MEIALNSPAMLHLDVDMECTPHQKIPFPWKLHEMLNTCEKEGLSGIVSWLPDKTSFRVHQPKVFMSSVIRNFFKQTKYKSFQRQLNIWGFQRIVCGPHKGGYTHKYFVRSKESLCCMMSRQKIKSEKPAKPRPYFPLKALTSHENGKPRGSITFPNKKASFEHHALNNLLGQEDDGITPINVSEDDDISPISISGDKNTCEDDLQKGMVPFNDTALDLVNRAIRLSSSLNTKVDQVPETANAEDKTRSPKGVESFTLFQASKRSISPLTFTGRPMVPDFDTSNDTNDRSSTSNLLELMEDLSPDPIAPDHPLSKQHMNHEEISSTSSINHLINDTIDDLLNNAHCHEQKPQGVNSLFERRDFFSLGDRQGWRSSLGA